MRPSRCHLFRLVCLALVLTGAVGPASGQLPPARALELEGIEVTPESSALQAAVADLLGLRVGDAIGVDELVAARRRLQSSGWFEDVQVFTRRGSRPGAVVLRIDTVLDERVRMETGLEHEPFAGWDFTVIGARAHHALGPASTARLGWKLGPRRSMLEADLELRRIASTRLGLLVHAEGGGEVWNAFVEDDLYTQVIERGAFELGLRMRLTPRWNATLWAGASSADPREIEQREGIVADPPADLVGPQQDRAEFSDLALHVTYDARDLAQPWRQGLWSTFRVRGSSARDGPSFWRARTAVRAALPLPAEQSIAMRFDAAWSDPSTPYYLRPVFGGQGSVRGFREASLSGGRGARGMVAAALEWRVPVLPRSQPDPRVHGALFVDTGSWVDSEGEVRDWSTSVGWGVRVRMPWIGRVALDVGVPLTATATGDPFWVHGSLGFGF